MTGLHFLKIFNVEVRAHDDENEATTMKVKMIFCRSTFYKTISEKYVMQFSILENGFENTKVFVSVVVENS